MTAREQRFVISKCVPCSGMSRCCSHRSDGSKVEHALSTETANRSFHRIKSAGSREIARPQLPAQARKAEHRSMPSAQSSSGFSRQNAMDQAAGNLRQLSSLRQMHAILRKIASTGRYETRRNANYAARANIPEGHSYAVHQTWTKNAEQRTACCAGQDVPRG